MDITIFKDKWLTKKNIILLAIVIVLIIIAITLFVILQNTKKEKLKLISFSSKDSSISISVPNEYNFSEVDVDSYVLSLKSSSTGSGIYISEVSANNIKDFTKFVESDKNDYISKFPNISQVSDVSESTINGLRTFNYNFCYKDNMYVDVYWILKDSNFITVDFNVNKDNLDMTQYISEILNSLQFN